MATLISILLFVILMTAIVWFGHRHYARPGRVYEQLGGLATFTMPGVDKLPDSDEPGLVVRVIEQIGEKLPVGPEAQSALRQDLLLAGYSSDDALPIYLGSRLLLCVLLVALAVLFGPLLITQNHILRVVLMVAAGFAGFYGPSLYLDHLISARRERIRFALPDALDMMVIAVEAGLALDQAIQYVARELATIHTDVAEEFQRVHLEFRAGARRADALRNLAERTGEMELRKLVAVLIQTDRFGTSIADSLRTHSDFMRVRRRQQAEERANKVGVKMTFPIFFFILPAMIIFTAGPAVLQLFKYLFPLMRNAHI